MEKQSQKMKVLRFLLDFGTMTPLDAIREFGIMRLAARVWELRREGYAIDSKMEKSVNRYGEEVRYARYSIAA